jgi:hypothetical protein
MTVKSSRSRPDVPYDLAQMQGDAGPERWLAGRASLGRPPSSAAQPCLPTGKIADRVAANQDLAMLLESRSPW